MEEADGYPSIFDAEAKASELVAAAGGGEVSNSKGVVYFVSGGDSP